VVALRQERLKLLVAYSTVAQIGYLFLMFPLAFDAGAEHIGRGDALTGGMLQAISHASAKAAMFMAAGLIYHAVGHDRIAELAGVARALPISVLTFVVAGLALMGVPPSGAYVAKKLLLDAAAGSGQWWWELVMQAGGFLTASYVVLVLAHALRPADAPIKLHAPVSRLAEMAALALALCSLLLGIAAVRAGVPDALSSAFTPGEVWSVVLLIVGGVALAAGLARQLPSISVGKGVATVGHAVRGATVALGALFVRVDGALRQWPVAGLALIALAIAFGATLSG
jgi:NADH:ubiquinone oxidoreductase subunit 5 (subunit L)/multisubunit Na+/H+ antiporter MnhA subunit